MEKYCRNYIAVDILDIVEKIKIRNREFKELKEKLEDYFKFEITDYIICDILDCENYNHVCLMINLIKITMKCKKISKMILFENYLFLWYNRTIS